MKILFLSQIVPYPPHGGILQRSFNLLRELHRYNNEIYLLAFLHRNMLHSAEMVDESRRILSEFCKHVEYFELLPKKSPWHFYKAIFGSLFREIPFCALAYRSTEFEQKVKDISGSHRIDIVHADTIGLAQFVEDGKDICTVLSHIDIESKLLERRSNVESGRFGKLYLRSQAKKAKSYEILYGPRFDVNIMMSEVDENEIKQMVPDIRTSVVPNGVDTEYYQPRIGEEGNILIYVGGMNSFANRDAVLFFLREIWPKIKRRRAKSKFIGIGENPGRELIDISRRDRDVEFPGYVKDIRPFVSKASVYVVPLRVGGGTRLKILDAMAMGKAVISTRIGCEGLDVKHGTNIIIADEAAEFAESTIRLMEDASRRKELGAEARRLVESEYSWGKIGRKLQETYEEVLKRS